MNDAMGDSGSGSGYSSGGPGDLAPELKRAATEAWIKEREGEHRVNILDTSVGAEQRAKEQLAETWDLVTIEEGYYLVGKKEDIAADQDAFMWSYWGRDSASYQAIMEGFAGVAKDLEWFDQLRPSMIQSTIDEMSNIISKLDQGGLAESANGIEAEMGKVNNGDNVDLQSLFKDESRWAAVGKVSEDLVGWNGYAAQMFKMAYMDRLPAILMGQTAIALCLRDTLIVAKHAFEGAQLDASELAQAYIDAFEADGSADVDWSKVLSTVEKVSTFAGKVADLVPVPGSDAISTFCGYVTKGASVANTIIGQFQENGGTPETKISVKPGDAESRMAEVRNQLGLIRDTLESIELAGADLLNAFYEIATSSEPGSKIYPDSGPGDGIQLTMREAFFEPKAPFQTSKGPGLGDIGADLSDDNSENDPTYEEISDVTVMNDPGTDTKHFGVSLDSLYDTGSVRLPGLADNYAEIAGLTGDISETNLDSAFTRESQVAGGSQSGAGTGYLLPAWKDLRDNFYGICDGSATNLELVGTALTFVAQSYAEHDDALADAVRESNGGTLPWD